MQDKPKHIELIIDALFSGTASESEIERLRCWINESPDNKALLDDYRIIHYLLKIYKQKKRYLPERAWQTNSFLLEQDKKPTLSKSNHFTRWFYRIACITVLAFTAGMVVMYYFMKPEVQTLVSSDHFSEYTVPYGSKAKLTLPDSSTVWVNAGSVLRYHSDFNQVDREVFVEGEAYFQVSKNPSKPFYVRTSTVTLKVLGTSFNLKAYPDETNIETTVEEGTVQVLSNIEGVQMGELILNAGQKATVARSKTQRAIEQNEEMIQKNSVSSEQYEDKNVIQYATVADDVDTEIYTGWKDKRWPIEQESLATLAIKLERRYDVKISFADEQLKRYSFSGVLENETLEQVLEAIKLSAPINYKVSHNQVILTRNKWIK